ncbi:MAG: biosynthetic-type acetolactate synthase large subunit [Synergistaceae bacterium]|nr:biosynthetic-type acetolactate synthase large subunit [Synergistaceae bacterium]
MEILSGSEMVIRALQAEGVEVVFGLPGGTVIPLYDAIHDTKKPFHVLVRHEQAAAHAADGYARASGRPGVCLATSGPGATNLVTGLATAWADSVPVVAITGQAATAVIGTDGFQEADMIGMTLPILKHSFPVREVERLPFAMKGAFTIAATRRPGPVLVDVPVDVQKARAPFAYPERVFFPGYRPEVPERLEDLPEAIEALKAAERPLLLAGGGANDPEAARFIAELAGAHGIPVAVSLRGKGVFPENHPLFLGLCGMHGTLAANRAVQEADFILALGTRFSERTTGRADRFAPRAKILHVDIDPAEIAKNVPSRWSLVGSVATVLQKIIEALGDLKKVSDSWGKTVSRWKEEDRARLELESLGFSPRRILKAIRSAMGDRALVTTDVGQHQMWAAQHFEACGPRSFITSGGMGTMGFGLPAAIGAAFAAPDRPLACLTGDGSFLMNIQELDTCARYGIPVKIFLFNNGSLGMVRQWQELFYKERYAHTVTDGLVDFARIAEAFGVQGTRVSSEQEVDGAIEGALAADGPALVEFRIAMEEKVFPMIPPGGGMDEMIEG